MRRQGLVKIALAGGVAVAFLGMMSREGHAQCSSCGSNATPYVPGNHYIGGGFLGAGATQRGEGLSPEAYSQYIGKGTQPLFDNYFTQGNANQATAGMYISPIGVPGWVGHTYYTNQALYPHHYLYHHHDRYHSYYDQGRGLNRTHASYSVPPIHTALKSTYKKIRLPHQ
ncbi:MAG: hypothetical protein ACK553_01980 [Planctomycetota bacterium]|jgi:hypothetical protein